MDDEDDDEGGPKRLADAEEVQVRDIRYNLEKIVGNNQYVFDECFWAARVFLWGW